MYAERKTLLKTFVFIYEAVRTAVTRAALIATTRAHVTAR